MGRGINKVGQQKQEGGGRINREGAGRKRSRKERK